MPEIMKMNKPDKIVIKDIAYAVGDVLMRRFEKTLKDKIEIHAATCPSKKMWILYAGIAIGSGAGGVLGGAGILRLLS